MLEHPPFEVFFSALHRGQRPLPWQQRLASQVSWDGWPVVPIGVPTGLGKTACLDIAVWALAGQAGRRPAERTLPTRTWYVVNRRLLVDAAHAHGDKMKRLLTSPVLVGKEGPEQEWEASPEHVLALQLMRASLKSLGALNLEEPLGTVRLRGGAELGARPPDPSQPCLVFATVPMFASRWLFRGYGTSTSMRPVDAALAGIDTLVLLDEAHLAAPLALLADPLAECDPGDPTLVLPLGRCRPTFVSLTATSGEGERFDLTAQDYEHPIVRDRMGAAKPTTLVETTAKDLSKELAGQAVALLEESSRRTCLVFVNTAARARDVHTRLVGAGREVLLVTGRARDWEADALRARLLDPHCGVAAGREEGSSEPPLWIVATQTLEVGADIDVDALVTQSAGVRALVQRFGRLNRFGHRPRAAAAICHAFDLEDLVYGDEPLVAWERLCDAGSGVSLSPEAIGSILGEPADKLDRGCEPLPGLVWEWAKTSLRSWGEAPPEAYFSNLNEDVARVSVCWRAYRPPDGIRLIPSVAAAESIELPIGELRRALQDRGELTLRRLSDDKATLESAALGELRPGDVVIVDAAQGLYDEFGWNPSETRLVPDVSLFEARILPLKKEAIENLVAPDDVTLLLDLLKELDAAGGYEGGPDGEFDEQWADQMITALRESQPRWLTPEQWLTYCGGLASSVSRTERDTICYVLAKPQRQSSGQSPVRADVFDEFSFDVTPEVQRTLAGHLASVGDVAERIGRRLGLKDSLCAAVARAARWHDLGKADPRFQRWLAPERHLDSEGNAAPLMAKSDLRPQEIAAARKGAGWPRGGRHEALSSRLVQSWLEVHGPLGDEDAQLVIHLVASHHGHGRPSLPVVADPNSIPVVTEIDGHSVLVGADLAQADWSQPERFRRLCERYGYWGLALLESIVRLADHSISKGVAG